MRGFIRSHLDPADRLGETLFGLIMALGFTGAVKWAQEEADAAALRPGDVFGSFVLPGRAMRELASPSGATTAARPSGRIPTACIIG